MSTATTHRRSSVGQRLRNRWASWGRLKKTGALAVALLAVTALVAAAALMLRASITGGVTVESTPVLSWDSSSAPVVTTSDDGAACTASTSGGSLAVSFSIAYAGSWCQVSGSLATNTSRGIKVQSVRFATGIAAGFVSGCGQTVSNVTPTPVMIRFTVPAAATAGNYLAVSDAGVTAVATEDYLTASCPLAP